MRISATNPNLSVDEYWLKYAIKLAHQSIPSPSAYCVGAVLVYHHQPTNQAQTSTSNGTDLANLNPYQFIQAYKSTFDPEPINAPSDTFIISTGYSREIPGNTHAEETCFIKLQKFIGSQLPSDEAEDQAILDMYTSKITNHPHVTLYTTMEPCSKRLSGSVPCTDHCIRLNVNRIVIGISEPQDIFVQCTGISQLQQAGIDIVLVSGFEQLCWEPNRHIRPEF